MKHLSQNLKDGEVLINEVPMPMVRPGKVLIKTKCSLISLGTEKMLLDFGKAGWVSKAKQQPDKVKMVLEKISTDGLAPTIKSVKNKLDTPLPLGYSNVGVVLDVGEGVTNFKKGDRVLSNGSHAEVVCISENLCAKIPSNVSDEDAAFTVVGSIGLQGIRLLDPTLGEVHVVIGLGLIGLLSVQILLANGCKVIGFDLDEAKVAMAKSYGADAFVSSGTLEDISVVNSITNGVGADGVLITASTKSNGPIELSPKICRTRGRVVLVGVIGLELNRTDFYTKEISFQVSCSYGPGRYDKNYEDKGVDYPIGFVRWTENRNFQTILELISKNKLKVKSLISREEDFEASSKLYKELGKKNDLGIILKYANKISTEDRVILNPVKTKLSGKATVGVIGAGSFLSSTLLPEFKRAGFRLKTISSSGGVSSQHVGKKFEFEENTTNNETIFTCKEIDTIVIGTPHSSHGRLSLRALKEGKHVFVEKPLSLDLDEIQQIEEFFSTSNEVPQLMIGFNRRFSPLIIEIKKRIQRSQSPKSMVMTVNAGNIPSDHWIHDMGFGGGRLVGEACHFVDLLRHLAGSQITSSNIQFANTKTRDTFTISLSFKDGSIGAIHYFSNGNKKVSKEKLDVFIDGTIYQLDNFKKLKIISPKSTKKISLRGQDKGHKGEVELFKSTINEGKKPLIPLEEIFEVSRTVIELNNQC